MNFDISKLANLKEGAGQRKPSLFKPKGARPTPTKQTQATQEAEPATQPLTSQTQDVAAHVAPSHGGVSASGEGAVMHSVAQPSRPSPDALSHALSEKSFDKFYLCSWLVLQHDCNATHLGCSQRGLPSPSPSRSPRPLAPPARAPCRASLCCLPIAFCRTSPSLRPVRI